MKAFSRCSRERTWFQSQRVQRVISPGAVILLLWFILTRFLQTWSSIQAFVHFIFHKALTTNDGDWISYHNGKRAWQVSLRLILSFLRTNFCHLGTLADCPQVPQHHVPLACYTNALYVYRYHGSLQYVCFSYPPSWDFLSQPYSVQNG